MYAYLFINYSVYTELVKVPKEWSKNKFPNSGDMTLLIGKLAPKLTYQINEDRVHGIGELIFRPFLNLTWSPIKQVAKNLDIGYCTEIKRNNSQIKSVVQNDM